jgi:HEAT repeat protein
MQVSFWSSVARSLGISQAGVREVVIQQHITNLTHPAEDMRRSAAWQLGKMRGVPETAVEALKKSAATDSSSVVRKASKWALKSLNIHE